MNIFSNNNKIEIKDFQPLRDQLVDKLNKLINRNDFFKKSGVESAIEFGVCSNTDYSKVIAYVTLYLAALQDMGTGYAYTSFGPLSFNGLNNTVCRSLLDNLKQFDSFTDIKIEL